MVNVADLATVCSGFVYGVCFRFVVIYHTFAAIKHY